MTTNYAQEDLEEQQKQLETERKDLADLERELHEAQYSLEQATELSEKKRMQRAIDAISADVRDVRREVADLEKRVPAYEAAASMLGRLARVAFREVQYDYDETECYPGVVAAMQEQLDEMGYKLVNK